MLSPAVRPLLVVLLGSLCLLPAVSAQTPTPVPPLAEKPEFHQLVPEGAAVEKILTSYGFLEGPAWNPLDHTLVFSDQKGNCQYRYDPASGQVSVFRVKGIHANGDFYDADGSLYTCSAAPADPRLAAVFMDARYKAACGSVIKRPVQGKETTVAAFYDFKLLNSPNDVVVKRDGTVWFTDPTYGIAHAKEQTANRVYCVDHQETNQVRAVAEDFDQPNGLCFSPDETRLYVADSGKPRNVHVYDVSKDNQLSNGRVFCAIDKGVPDGMRCDEHGNLWSTSDVGVQVFNPAGERLGVIPVPEVPANLCFGGPDGHDLYITARTSLYRIRVAATGATASK